jgi:hypothetical protein
MRVRERVYIKKKNEEVKKYIIKYKGVEKAKMKMKWPQAICIILNYMSLYVNSTFFYTNII